MTQRHKIQLFEDKKVRTAWDDEREEWYFSIVDECAVLSESENPQTYWRVLKNRLKKEGNETVTNCNALKMLAPDGKMRLTDVASTEQLFRLIQSIPSKKAEPFKQWMAQVARERLDQMADPELAIDQAIQDWRRKGYSENWINNRVKSIEVRKPSPTSGTVQAYSKDSSMRHLPILLRANGVARPPVSTSSSRA